MIERLIENWLASSGERGYETPFAQVLAAEEHRILQGPVHHPFEHGKDILTISPSGELQAYQLKGPGLTNLEEFEKIQAQLMALAGTAIAHPSVTPPRRADRVFLVTNATLTPPVRDRLEKFNAGNVPLGWPPIEPIEREQLLARFVAAHGQYLPQSLTDVRSLLELYYSDPSELFPVKSFSRFLDGVLPFPPQAASMPECRRAVASATLLTAYAASSWERAENHLCVAQAWLTACVALLRFAAVRGLGENVWRPSYELALESARTMIASLSKEAADAPDLVVPDVMDGTVYPSRALLICGFLGAYLISERTLIDADRSTIAQVETVLRRESKHVRLAGEADVPAFLMVACALGQIGEIPAAEGMVLSLARTLSKANQRHSQAALADPYHDTEQVLLHQIGADSDLDGEQFDGRAYMLHIAIEWLARRLWRQHLASMWSDITHVEFCEFRPSRPDCYLAVSDDQGTLVMWQAGQPQSWAALLAQARELDRSKLPDVLWARRELIPYLPLLFPYRLTSTLASAIDTIAATPQA